MRLTFILGFLRVSVPPWLSWAAGHVGYIHPFGVERGRELKRLLIRAAIAGIEAIWQVNPRARIVQVEPLIHVVPPKGHPELAEQAAAQRASQFEAWDMMTGGMEPGLGGHPKYLDIMGLNYYHSNQWEYADVRMRWEDHPRDERWVPLHELLAEIHTRYRRPLFLGETSHFGAGPGVMAQGDPSGSQNSHHERYSGGRDHDLSHYDDAVLFSQWGDDGTRRFSRPTVHDIPNWPCPIRVFRLVGSHSKGLRAGTRGSSSGGLSVSAGTPKTAITILRITSRCCSPDSSSG